MVDAQMCENLILEYLEFEKNLEEQFRIEILEPYKAAKARLKRQRRVKKGGRKKNQPPVEANDAGTDVLPSIPEEASASDPSQIVRTSQRSAAKKATELVSKQLQQSLLEKLRNPDTGTKKRATALSAVSPSPSLAVATPQLAVTSVAEGTPRVATASVSVATPQLATAVRASVSVATPLLATTAPLQSGLSSVTIKEKVALLECVVVLNRCSDELLNGGSPEKTVETDVNRSSKTQDDDRDKENTSKSPKRSADTVTDKEMPRKRSKTSEEQLSREQTECAGSEASENSAKNMDAYSGRTKTETSSDPLVDFFKVPYVVLNKSSVPLNLQPKQSALSSQSCGKLSESENVEGVSDSGVSSEGTSNEPPSSNCTTINVDSVDFRNAEASPEESKQGPVGDATFVVPEPCRPARIRTKNRKYDDSFVEEPILSKKKKAARSKQVVVSQTEVSKHLTVSDPIPSSDNPSSKRADKRKPEFEDSNSSSKSVKLTVKQKDIEQDKGGESTVSSAKSTVSLSSASDRSDRVESSSGDLSPSSRSRTRTITKPTVANIVVIDPIVVESSSCSSEIVDGRDLIEETPKPEPRMTRTRTKEINRNQAKLPDVSNAVVLNTLSKNGNKENEGGRLIKLLCASEKSVRISPLAPNNYLFSPTKVISSSQKKMVTSSLTKQLSKDPTVKKKEHMQAQTEGAKRKREEREKRIQATKVLLEAKNLEKLDKLRKEKEEKEKQVVLAKRLKEKQLQQKKQMNEALLKVAEERRIREEEAKQARIRKQEEDKKKLAEERMKMAEEAKKQHEMRLAQEAKEKELSMKEKEKELKKAPKKPHVAAGELTNYNLTPHKNEVEPKPPKSENNYGLSDAESGDSTDDEKQPKKAIPKWATKSARKKQLIYQSFVHPKFVDNAFLCCSITADVRKTLNSRCRPRASSATWNTPESSNASKPR